MSKHSDCLGKVWTVVVVVAQLVERLLTIPEVRGSTPVIGKIFIEHLFIINCIEKTKINKKRPGMAHFLKKFEQLIGENFFNFLSHGAL